MALIQTRTEAAERSRYDEGYLSSLAPLAIGAGRFLAEILPMTLAQWNHPAFFARKADSGADLNSWNV
jgi:hypothetical protein